MLDAALKTQVATHLGRLQNPIELIASLDAGESSLRLRALLEELAALSPLVQLRLDGEDARRPSFSVGPAGDAARVRFAGVPLGHEFTSLVLALLQAGGVSPRLDAAALEQARGLDAALDFEVFVSLSCHNCPEVVQALNALAVVNPKVRSTMIDGALYQDEINARGIQAVPVVYLNGAPFGHGRMGVEEILARVDQAGAARRAAALARAEPFDVLVVGGGPAAAAAAVYAARKGIRTGVVAERFGGQVLDTLAIENFISVPATEGPKLAVALEQHVKDYNVDILHAQRAEALVPGSALHEVRLAGGASLQARSVIVATGARWRELGVPGEAQYKTRGVCFCPHCDGPLFKGRRVAVVGGGNSGVEAAIDLAGIVEHVTLLEFDQRLRADAVLQERLHSLPNVTVLTGARTTEILGDGERVTGLRYEERASGQSHDVALAGVFVQIGLLPNTDWLRGTLALSPRGEVEVDAAGRTSVPGVFAAGDCTTVPFKQIVIALGEGAKASLAAFEHLLRTPVPAAAAAPASALAA